MLIGIVALALSFLPWFIDFPGGIHAGAFFALLWAIGYLSVCSAIIHSRTKQTKNIMFVRPHAHIYVIGLISALFIESFGNWTWKLWWYPPFSSYAYMIFMPIILIFYFYIILKGYLAARVLLEPYRKKIKFNVKKYRILFDTLGIVGCFGFIVGIIQAVSMLHIKGLGFFNSFGIHRFNLLNVIIVSISLLFILEYLEYREREDTFLLHLIKGDFVPLLCVVIATLFTAISMEALNVPLSIWVYTNWPYANISISGLPFTVFVAWIIQYILLISLYRVMYKKETHRIWG